MLTNTTNSKNAKVHPLHFSAVTWKKGFWADVTESNTQNTIPHLQKMFEAKDISHVIENFKICAGLATGDFDGTVFGDGDFYKWMEAAIYSAVKNNNQELLRKIDEYIDLISKAQLEDGYISTKQIIGERTNNGTSRLGDINDFEVYNFGHLFTTASLHKRLTGKDNFLMVAKKAAGYLENLYAKNLESDDVQTAVCPSHYMGLIELYRTTGDERYLRLGELAIHLRDNVHEGLDDNQDRLPVREHEKIIGHAVRANYLYAGVADLCLEKTDQDYLTVLDKVWANLVDQKLYLTGGCGALYNGASPYGNFFNHQLVHQAYGYEYQLPNITAYNETCASVGSVMWAYRMFQLDPQVKYFDFIERTMLNVNLAAVSLDGKKYFYENMLRRAKKLPYELVWPLTRSEYILSYCCPPNLARAIAESSEYTYTVSNDTLWLGMYGASASEIELPNGTTFLLNQDTAYPYDGKINLSFTDITGPEFTVNIRIPNWITKGSITSGDKIIQITKEEAGTYLPIKVTGNSALIHIDFAMEARYTITHPLVEEDNLQVAVERGPLVYCLESEDTSLDTLNDIIMDPGAVFKPIPFSIANRDMIALESEAFHIKRDNYDPNALYQTLSFKGLEKVKIRMIPYFAWDNRSYGEMRIFMGLHY